ncbi:MAG TPA: hypothetical protein VFM88_23610 [Vicinamibacteria bacterium]|nr:hypothetical protein [Vicinamibacteria bacterium]
MRKIVGFRDSVMMEMMGKGMAQGAPPTALRLADSVTTTKGER